MKIEINYGNTIHGDNTIAKYTTYNFNSMQELKDFWQTLVRVDGNVKRYSADLKALTIVFQEYVSSEDYFNNSGDIFTVEADF
jgi:hypothetical protein